MADKISKCSWWGVVDAKDPNSFCAIDGQMLIFDTRKAARAAKERVNFDTPNKVRKITELD
jgi:hypothetical protein